MGHFNTQIHLSQTCGVNSRRHLSGIRIWIVARAKQVWGRRGFLVASTSSFQGQGRGRGRGERGRGWGSGTGGEREGKGGSLQQRPLHYVKSNVFFAGRGGAIFQRMEKCSSRLWDRMVAMQTSAFLGPCTESLHMHISWHMDTRIQIARASLPGTQTRLLPPMLSST